MMMFDDDDIYDRDILHILEVEVFVRQHANT